MKQLGAKKKIKRKIVIESIFVFFIAISPFLYKIYDFFPENPEATISFLGITIGNNGFADISTFVWFMASKIIPLYLLVFWFLTAKNWWYHIILIPIGMYAFQIFEVLYSHDSDIDTENLLWLLPICMIVIPFVYFIRIRLYDKYVHGIDLEAMEEELRVLKEKQALDNSSKEKKNQQYVTKDSKKYRTLTEKIERGLSTENIERQFKKLQHSMRSFLHL